MWFLCLVICWTLCERSFNIHLILIRTKIMKTHSHHINTDCKRTKKPAELGVADHPKHISEWIGSLWGYIRCVAFGCNSRPWFRYPNGSRQKWLTLYRSMSLSSGWCINLYFSALRNSFIECFLLTLTFILPLSRCDEWQTLESQG